MVSTAKASRPADGWIVMALAAASAAALTNILLTLTAITTAYVPIPFWDGWEEVSTERLWYSLFAPHGPHRLVVYRLVALLDQAVTQGRYLINFATSLALQALQAGLLIVLAVSAAKLNGREGALAAALTIGFLFWGVQHENFIWAFQTQFFAVTTFGTLSFFLLATMPGPWGAAAAVVASTLAVGSMAGGVVVPPLLIGLSAALRRPVAQTVAIALTAAILLGLYFGVGYETPDRGSPDRLWTDPFGLAFFFAAYLGGPFAWLGASMFGVTPSAAAASAGLLALIAVAGVGLQLLVRPQHATAPRLALLCTALYGLGTGLMISVGRIHLGIDQALVHRYTTPALVFWLALLFLAWSLGGRAGRRILPLGATLLLLLTLPDARSTDAAARSRRDIADTVATAALTRVNDTAAASRVYPGAERVTTQTQVMRENRTGIFAWPAAQWLGTPLSAHVAVDGAERCRGAFDVATPLPADSGEGAFRVQGWAWQADGAGPPRMLLLTDGAGTVIGYALTDVARPDVPAAIPELRAALFSGWRGHVRIGAPGPVTAFALSPDDARACPVGTRMIP